MLRISCGEVTRIKDLGLFERSPLQIHLNLFGVQFITMQCHCKQHVVASCLFSPERTLLAVSLSLKGMGSCCYF